MRIDKIKSIDTSKRIEIKEVYKSKDLNLLYAALKYSGFAFRKTFQPRKVNSVYFDTFAMNFLTQSLEGNRDRKKIRVRWYGDNKKKCPATLEIKNKKGVVSWKNLYEKQLVIKPNEKRWKHFFNYASEGSHLENMLNSYFPTSISLTNGSITKVEIKKSG